MDGRMLCWIYNCLVSCGQTLFPAGTLYCFQYKRPALKGQLYCFSGIILEQWKTKEQNAGMVDVNYNKIHFVNCTSYVCLIWNIAMQNARKGKSSPFHMFVLCWHSGRKRSIYSNRAVSTLGLGFANSIQLYNFVVHG